MDYFILLALVKWKNGGINQQPLPWPLRLANFGQNNNSFNKYTPNILLLKMQTAVI